MKKKDDKIIIKEGFLWIPGVTRMENGYNFTVEAREDAEVTLILYQKKTMEVLQEIPLDDEWRTGRVRSVHLEGLNPKTVTYNYRIDGKLCHDPRAVEVYGRDVFGELPQKEICSGFPEETPFSWEDETAPKLKYEEMILYKVHVRGYTKDYKGRLRHKGTFEALTEMIPYWKELGVNAIELMPAYEFSELPETEPATGMVTTRRDSTKVNFWGYIPGFYFAPKRSYCASARPEESVKQFVKALHKEGMECILEFYFPAETDAAYALRALQWWKMNYHIDGFHVLGEGAPLDLIFRDGLLSETKILTSGGNYGARARSAASVRTLAEYNSGFLNDARQFLKSDEDMVGKVIEQIRRNYGDHSVVKYIASQDGFTLRDLVTYTYRHNEANGQNNQDGISYNYSWNCGVEGPTRKASIRQRREQQIRNALFLVLLSQGTPLLYGGDEFGNTQDGNNNAWCQDNPLGWINWKEQRRHTDLTEFVKETIAFRKANPIFSCGKELLGTDYKAYGVPDFSLHGERAWYVSYDNTSRMFGILYNQAYQRDDASEAVCRPEDFLYVAYNFHWEDRRFALPSLPAGIGWKKVADTSAGYRECFRKSEEFFKKSALVCPRSIAVFAGEEEKQ